MIGTPLSHYRITEKLGQGGMGEVYRAEDTNLSRQVAIKVLPDEFAHDAERLTRFEREAKLLASLNHCNIAAIYGLEEHEGKRFLILELVEGPTLAERLKRGRIPLDETLDVCRQIAEGLEAAHEKGIIHRDLKPANVKVTPEGKVKILDFGLAKAFQVESSTPDVSKSPTLTSQMTHAGVILGTAAYMSPEQAKGRAADKRADIWAFGCVLYECLTGKRAFEGETITETVAAILKSEPDLTPLSAGTPAFVRSLLRRCLQKDPDRRLHDIADARIELQEGLSEPAEVLPVAGRMPFKWLLPIGMATLVVGFLAGIIVMKYFKPAAPAPSPRMMRFHVRVLPGRCLSGPWRLPTRTAMTLSSDGSFVIYSAINENTDSQDESRLYLHRFEEMEAKPIPGTEGAISPFLSPDDRWIGFWADGKLMKVSVSGGVPATLCDIPSFPFGSSWGSDNQIIFAPGEDSGLSSVSADGGKPETLTVPDRSKEEYGHHLPHCLPGGKGILFTILRSYFDMNPRVAVMETASRKWRVLLEDAADARYAASGHLIFLRQGTLMTVPFDPGRLEVSGRPVPAVAGIAQALNLGSAFNNTAAGQFSVSASGSLAYVPGGVPPDRQNTLVWVDHRGKSEPAVSLKVPFSGPRLSPDGRRIAYSTSGKERQVWVHDLQRGTSTKLITEGAGQWATWTPDGRRLAFRWSKAGTPNIYWRPADGGSPMERLAQSEHYQHPGSWSPDGETLAFLQEDPAGIIDILLLRVRDRGVTPFLNSRFEEMYPEFSPNGRWMAYTVDESGRSEVCVQAFPGPGAKLQISNAGGSEPLWSRDGRQLFYRWQNQVWAVDVQAGSGISAGKPRLLFEQPGYLRSAPNRGWDISSDGRRFLMVKRDDREAEPVTEMILVLNWFEELERLCPAGKYHR